MPDLSTETSTSKINWENFHYCCLLELRLLSRYKPGKKYVLNKQYALLSQLRLLTHVYSITGRWEVLSILTNL